MQDSLVRQRSTWTCSERQILSIPLLEQDWQDRVLVVLNLDPTNWTSRIRIQSSLGGDAADIERLWRRDQRNWCTGYVAGLTRSRSSATWSRPYQSTTCRAGSRAARSDQSNTSLGFISFFQSFMPMKAILRWNDNHHWYDINFGIYPFSLPTPSPYVIFSDHTKWDTVC